MREKIPTDELVRIASIVEQYMHPDYADELRAFAGQIEPLESQLAAANMRIRELEVSNLAQLKELVNQAACMVADERRIADLEAGLRKLVVKLHDVDRDPQYRSLWPLFMVHGGNYTGPDYQNELDGAEKLIGDRAIEFSEIGEHCGINGHPCRRHSSRMDSHWMICPDCGGYKCQGHKGDCRMARPKRGEKHE
jgi:uncharacterized coiled-coil protein SlyX